MLGHVWGSCFYQLDFFLFLHLLYFTLEHFFPSLASSCLSSGSCNPIESKLNSIQSFCQCYNYIILPSTSHAQRNTASTPARHYTPTALALAVSKHFKHELVIALRSMVPWCGLQDKHARLIGQSKKKKRRVKRIQKGTICDRGMASCLHPDFPNLLTICCFSLSGGGSNSAAKRTSLPPPPPPYSLFSLPSFLREGR